MKKLLFVILSLRCGGAERSLINLISALPRDKYQIDLLLFRRSGEFLSQVPEDVNILDTPEDLKKLFGPISSAGRLVPVKLGGTLLGRIFDGKTTDGKMMFRWRHFYKKALSELPGRYDAAVGYLEGESTYYVCDFVNAARKIAWVHSDYSSLGNRAEDDAPYFQKLDAVVTISDKCRNSLKDTFPEIRDRFLLLENITSAAAIRRQAEGSVPAEIGAGVFHIVSVGRISYEKGFDIAIEAAAILKKTDSSFKWLIIGEGNLHAQLQEQINRYGLQNEVFLTGIRTNPYVYMKNSDLLVQPSRFEGKSIVVDEAKMLGLPMLLTRYPTAGDQITDGQEGWIVDMDPKAVAEGILHVMHNQQLLKDTHDYLMAHDYDNIHELKKYEALFDA